MIDLDMSPYAAFVWPAWAITALVLAALVARALIASHRWTVELRRLEMADPAPPIQADGSPSGAQAARLREPSDSPTQTS